MRTIRYALAAAAAVAAVTAPSASANQAIIENLREGCYGVGVVICDPQFSQFPVGTDFRPVPVCVNTCTEVDVPFPRRTGEGLCVTWSDNNGNVTETCAT